MKKLFRIQSEKSQNEQLKNQSESVQNKSLDKRQDNQISNRQKISKLHQRIKLLDKLNILQNEKNYNVNYNNLNKSLNNDKEGFTNFQKQNQPEEESIQANFTMGAEKNDFANRFSSPKASELQNNYQNNLKFKQFSKISPQSPINQNLSSSINYNTIGISKLQNNNSQSQNSVNRQNYSSPKHNNSVLQSQKYLNSNPQLINPSLRPSSSYSTQFYPLQANYLTIEDKFLKFKLSQQNLVKNIEAQILDLQNSCKSIKRQFEKIEKKNEQHLQTCQKSLNSEIQELYEQLKQLKKGAVESIDTKYKAIKTETLAMISEQFQNQCKKSSNEIQIQIQSVSNKLNKEQQLRDETAQFLINSFGDEIIKIEEILNKQRQSRIEKHDELFKLINDVQNNLFDKLNREKKEMVESIQTMENMLEQVCYKIEQKILGN